MIKIIKVTNRIWGNVNNAQRLSASVLRFSTSVVKGFYDFILSKFLF